MKKETKVWMIRAGQRAFLIDDFIEKEIIAIGWNELGDLKNTKDLEQIKTALKNTYPSEKQFTQNMNAGQIYRFVIEFNIGDYVVTYNPNERVYWLGQIKSDYYYTNSILNCKVTF